MKQYQQSASISNGQRKKLMNSYPRVADVREKCRKRIPNVAWQYLHTGTGIGEAEERNRKALSEITLLPQFMKGELTLDTSTTLFGKKVQAPFGVAPIGMPSLIWPKADKVLAKMAQQKQIPYCLSTVGTATPETIGSLVGDMGWFQLYPPKDLNTLHHLLERVKNAGFKALVFTADIPKLSRREEAKKAGFTLPPKITPKLVWDGLTHPKWLKATLWSGIPNLPTVRAYSPLKDRNNVAVFARTTFRAAFDWEYLKRVRELWQLPIVLKGLLHPDDIETALTIGVDAIGVSNHGGRQFDGAPAAIHALPNMVRMVGGKIPVLFDSGVTSGLDVIRALALGADFVLLGRAFMYGLGALGKVGATHVFDIVYDELCNNMIQLGVSNIEEIKKLQPFAKPSMV